ncbi:DeoR/GlpR family DNA-binding transcription regulator [Vibrio sp. JC009]|uniref:DeoR/GlpR family DNA-binding transcription regulator n=1 Tax=Vibrio sp. JC009 TaxID=2912314 RepID=UPI0023AFAAE2|nr:DeoR/GlpR family DNA-binding transcription regulator [Vibrio sp. JC009]WED24841.1 DeoR/GlpR family DNA-binding transcription regulator [Vibrio sp. JC009]
MTNPRQDKLLQLVIDKGYCTVEELAEILEVSTQTIRRDIKKLSDERLLVRHHGGASSPSSTVNLDYEIRKVSETEEKNAIGERITQMIPDNSTIFLTIGTTTEIIASHLLKKNNIQVITNSLRVANVLHTNKSFDVLIPSGKVRAKNGGIVGTEALEFIKNFRFDYMITSAGSMDVDGTLLEYDLNETAIAQEVMKSARNVFVALDSTKYVPKGSIELGNVKEATVFFTDVKPSAEICDLLEGNDVKLEICN